MRLAALVFLLIIGITPLGAEDGVWIIREREVPPPTDVSPQLRESIRNAPQPDVAKAQSFAVSTPEEWREENRRLEPDNQARAKAALDLAESYGVSVVEGSIAGVTVHRLTPFLIDEEHVDHLFIYVHGGAYVRVAVEVRLVCGTAELTAVLHALESGSPRLFVDNLDVLAQRMYGAGGATPQDTGGVDASFDLSGYLPVPGEGANAP